MSPSDQILAQTLHMYVCMYIYIYIWVNSPKQIQKTSNSKWISYQIPLNLQVKNLLYPPSELWLHKSICNPPLEKSAAELHVVTSNDVKPIAFSMARLMWRWAMPTFNWKLCNVNWALFSKGMLLTLTTLRPWSI